MDIRPPRMLKQTRSQTLLEFDTETELRWFRKMLQDKKTVISIFTERNPETGLRTRLLVTEFKY